MKKISEKISDVWGVPKDVIMDIPRITVSGDREIYIEHHRGLCAYDEDMIGIATGMGVVRIYGKGLVITAIRASDALIEGQFSKIEYEAKNVK